MFNQSEQFKRITDGMFVNGALTDEMNEAIKDLVLDTKSGDAAAINNQGPDKQKDWLVKIGFSMDFLNAEIQHDETLDDLVHESKIKEAFDMTSLDARIVWLLESGFTEEDLRKKLQAIKNNPDHGPDTGM